MKSRSPSCARRSLTFEELPFAGKTFYIDVKSASAKSKIIQRISSLGGQIENFLSKDLSLLITDKTAKQNAKDECSQKPVVGGVPLSRGQALLLKASSKKTSDTNNNNNHGLLQSAAKLGVQVETPAGFLRQTSKLLEKVKAERPASRLEDCLSGLSTISWDSEKENCVVIKVEDDEGLYRPLFKQFDTFPQISYSDSGCPFDVGVVLTKAKESNQTKKKSVGGALRGGYCESCDHWFKCTLREHLNSDKHKEFISAVENFKSLNQVSSCLPNLGKFVGKYGLKSDCISTELLSKTQSIGNEIPTEENKHKIPDGEEAFSEAHKSLFSLDNTNAVLKEVWGHENGSKTEPMLMSKLKSKTGVCTGSTAPIFKNHIENNSDTKLQKLLPGNQTRSERSCSNIENNDKRSTTMSSKFSRKFSVDDVLKSVTENDVYLSNGNHSEKDFMSKTSMESTHLKSNNCMKVNAGTVPSAYVPGSSNSSVRSNKENDECVTRSKKLPAMCFSSSSCSFGDNGIGNVILMLNSQHSSKSYGKENLTNANIDSVIEGSRKSASSMASKLSKEKSENIPIEIGKRFVSLNDEVVGQVCDMPVLEPVDVSDERGPDVELMPVLESYDSEDMNRFCSSLLNSNKVSNSNSVASNGFPEYSNITEESLQEKPHVNVKATLRDNLQTNFEYPVLDFTSNLVQETQIAGTPDKSKMDRLKTNIYENQTHSGSTIRNWLLPNDDTASVRSVNSPGNLNATLVNTSCNVEEDININCSKESRNVNHNESCISDIKETVDNTKVADWIQNQDFVKTVNTCENSRDGFQQDLAEYTKVSDCVRKQENENSEHNSRLRSCSERSVSENEDMNSGSKAWSDSGTSISDCTIDNLRFGQQKETADSENAKESVKDMDIEISNHDETSQDSGISAKTGLTSAVTANGLKITGLSSLSSHFFNAAENEHFTDSNNTSIDPKNTELYNDNAMNNVLPGLTPSDIEHRHVDIDKNNDRIQTLKCTMVEAVSVSSNVCTQSAVQLNTKPKNSNSSGKNIYQVKPKKQRTTKVSKAKKQTQSGNLLTQVLSSSLYSPASSAFGNTIGQNGYSDKENSSTCTSQTFPYCQGQAQGQMAGELYKNQFGQFVQNHTQVNNPARLPACDTSGYSMMDLLMSPDHQMNTGLQAKFHQTPATHQQYVNQQTQQSNLGMNGQYNPCLNTQQNAHQHFGALPFSQVYQNHTGSHSNMENNHHFLSSNSNFLMQNWDSGSSAKRRSKTVCQKPENSWNYPASHSVLSHDNSNSNGGLQTIDMSHIAENSREHDSYPFNFKLADTDRLKKGRTVSKKSVKRKVQKSKSNPAVPAVESQKNVCNNTSEVKASYDNVLVNNQTVYNELNNGVQSPSWQAMSYNTTSPCVSANYNRPFTPYSQSPSMPASCVQPRVDLYANHKQQVNMQFNRSQNMFENAQTYNAPTQYGYVNQHQNVYNAIQTGDTKLTLRRMSQTNITSANEQPKHDLMQYWNVRKAGDCRLVFKANVGKRKVEEETPSKSVYTSHYNELDQIEPLSKRRKCLVY